MKLRHLSRAAVTMSAVIMICFTISCVTVNDLDQYRFAGSSIYGSLRIPPEPSIDADYHIHVDPENPVLTIASVATNVAKASHVEKAERRMMAALEAVDVPGVVWEETYLESVRALNAEQTRTAERADFVFDMEIGEYGIDAGSGNGGARFEISVTARIYSNVDKALVWRRNIRVTEAVNPDFFGFGEIVGNIVTIATLAELSEDEMAAGFSRMAHLTATEISRLLEEDLYRAVYGI